MVYLAIRIIAVPITIGSAINSGDLVPFGSVVGVTAKSYVSGGPPAPQQVQVSSHSGGGLCGSYAESYPDANTPT